MRSQRPQFHSSANTLEFARLRTGCPPLHVRRARCRAGGRTLELEPGVPRCWHPHDCCLARFAISQRIQGCAQRADYRNSAASRLLQRGSRVAVSQFRSSCASLRLSAVGHASAILVRIHVAPRVVLICRCPDPAVVNCCRTCRPQLGRSRLCEGG